MDSLFSFESLGFEQHKKQGTEPSTLDLFSFNTTDTIVAPHPDAFESDLEFALSGIPDTALQLPLLEQDPFSFLRSETPTCGPLSSITVSSDSASAYESHSTRSESYYNYTPTSSAYSYPIDMDFARASINSNYETDNSHSPGSSSLEDFDTSSFGRLPTGAASSRAYSDYSTSDYYPPAPSHPSLGFNGTVSPSTISQARQETPANNGVNLAYAYPSQPQMQQQAGSSTAPAPASLDNDPRRRYACSQCPRAFARAYNLKTHMATHDPNRAKPHVCPHRSCGRSFSRKHDLGRHLVSIHRDDPPMAGGSPSADEESGHEEVKIGVAAQEGRKRCEVCGMSYMRDRQACTCAS